MKFVRSDYMNSPLCKSMGKFVCYGVVIYKVMYKCNYYQVSFTESILIIIYYTLNTTLDIFNIEEKKNR